MPTRKLVASQNGEPRTHSSVLTLADTAKTLRTLGVDVTGADAVLFSVEDAAGLGSVRYAFGVDPTNDGAGGLGHLAKAGDTMRFAGAHAVEGLRLVNKVAGTTSKVVVTLEWL